MLTLILLIIIGLFAVALVVKHIASFKVCALCTSIFLTWASLLVLYKIGKFNDVILLSLLMGQSITGIFYLIDRRINPALKIFTLPFFLSLTVLFYMVIVGTTMILPLYVLFGLWIVAYLIFASRNDPGRQPLTTAVMNCCEDK